MQFNLQGQAYHAQLESVEDLLEACALDEGLWVATSAPIEAFRMDPVFLRGLDTEQDKRIKAGELKAAVAWARERFRSLDGFSSGSTELKPESLNDTHPDCQKVIPLLNRFRGDAASVSLSKIRKARERLEASPVSEAGVVLPAAADSENVRSWMEKLLTAMPGTPHPSGKPGIDEPTLATFLHDGKRRLDWLAETGDTNRSDVLPLGEHTAKAFEIYMELRDRLDRFFALCDWVAVNPEAVQTLWPPHPDSEHISSAHSSESALKQAPPAKPNPEGILRMDNRMNPAYARSLHALRSEILIPLFDKTDEVLTRADWQHIKEAFERYATWRQAEPAPYLKGLTTDDLASMLNSPHIADIRKLLQSQTHAALDLTQVRLAEKMILFQACLLDFANNFISFPKLYAPDQRAAFEEGSLIMDGRRFNLAVRVPDRAHYLKGIEGGTMFIMIVKLEHPRQPESREIAVPATSGRKGNLRVGKHGLFQHVDGTEWFATLTHISDNPVSLAEAMAAPFQRIGATLTRKVEGITQNAEKNLDQSTEQVMTAPPPPPNTPNPAPGQMLAGGGIAIAAMGSSLAFMTKTFAELTLPQILGGLMVAILAVLIPSAVIAAIRLGRRDLSVLLEGTGWAINSRMRLSRAQRLTFTAKPPFPENSTFTRQRLWWLMRIFWVVFAMFLLSRVL
ncbi:MAG: hypothetical protein JJU05_15910 [Verrucomicrobia bacterium]|nr:hypothetical protein [Verrucomicrobiota bacterium]MCH8528243.1 hypothetical protein [Kiritimatiellia bacterium]